MVPVSIIITAYNVDKYLDNCLRSVVGQSKRDIEIIIINDGSTDNTDEIIERFENNDSRIIAIYQENAGVSAARNVGLKAARGKYVQFLDGDDMLIEDACESLYEKAISEDADIVIGDFYELNEDSGEKKIRQGGPIKIDSKDEFIDYLLEPSSCFSIWNKIIKRSMFLEHNIWFSINISMGEDFEVLFKLSFYQKKIQVLKKPIMVYLRRKASLVSFPSFSFYSLFEALENIENFIRDKFLRNSEILEKFKCLEYYHLIFTKVITWQSPIGKIQKVIFKRWSKKNINIFENQYFICFFRDLPLSIKIKVITFQYGGLTLGLMIHLLFILKNKMFIKIKKLNFK